MINEEVCIKAIQRLYPFGVTLQDLWETIIECGGNNPLVTKHDLGVVLETVRKEDIKIWKKNLVNDSRARSTKEKILKVKESAKIRLLHEMYADAENKLDFYYAIYQIYRVQLYSSVLPTGRWYHPKMPHPTEQKWDTEFTTNDSKGAKTFKLYYSTQTNYLKGMIKMLNFMKHGVIILGEEE